MDETNVQKSQWSKFEATFKPGPITPLTKRIRFNGPRRSTKRIPPRPQRNSKTLPSPKCSNSHHSEPEIFVEDSDSENQTLPILRPSQSYNNFNKSTLSALRPLSNISNSPRVTKEDDELFADYDPDTEPTPCTNCLEPSPNRKSPLAVLTFSRTKQRPISRTRKYSDDIFLEATIDSQSPPVIEVPETDSCSSSQPFESENVEHLEDLIESDSSHKSNHSSFNDCDLTLTPKKSRDFVIDESTNDSIIELSHVVDPSQCIPETSSSYALVDTIIESSSSNSNPLSNPLLLPINPKTKRLRAKKNGFLDQLNAAVNKAKSNFAFWHQERRMGICTSGTCFEVMEVDRSLGRCLIFVRNVEEYLMRADDTIRIGLLLDTEMKICTNIKVGVVVEVDLTRETEGVEVSDAEGREMRIYLGVQFIRIV